MAQPAQQHAMAGDLHVPASTGRLIELNMLSTHAPKRARGHRADEYGKTDCIGNTAANRKSKP